MLHLGNCLKYSYTKINVAGYILLYLSNPTDHYNTLHVYVLINKVVHALPVYPPWLCH